MINKKIITKSSAMAKNCYTLPSEGFIRPGQFANVLGISLTTFYKYISEDKIPKPFKFTDKMSFWSVDTVRSTIQKRAGFPISKTSHPSTTKTTYILPSEGFIRPKDFAFVLGVSRASLSSLVANSFIRAPIKDSSRHIKWHVDTVRETIANLLMLGEVGRSDAIIYKTLDPISFKVSFEIESSADEIVLMK